MTEHNPPKIHRSLHQTIRDDLESRILSGDWAPGHRIPSETDLSVEYGCSRMTVNKVMTQLATAGLILRRRRIGSVVLPQKSQNAVLEIHNVKDEVLARGGWYQHLMLRHNKRHLAVNDPLASNGAPGAAVLDLVCLHHSDETPFCIEERLIFLDAVPGSEDQSFTDKPPGVWLLDHVPWSEASNEIGACAADATMAERLHLAPGAPCLTMTRQTWKNGEPVTMAHFTYPGRDHSFKARFTPTQG